VSHFYGRLKGSKAPVERGSDKKSGLVVTAAGWAGAIQVSVVHNPVLDEDFFAVMLIPWGNAVGSHHLIAAGPLNNAKVGNGEVVQLNDDLVRRYTEWEATRIMKG
jgi:hypothetical protein